MESLSIRNKQKVAKLPEQVDESKLQTSSIMYNNSKKYSLISYGSNNETLFVQSPLFESIIDIDKYKEYVEYYFKIPQNEQGENFILFINKIEQKLMSLAYENKQSWFKDQENIKFRSLIKNLDDSNDNKVIKFRMPYNIKTKRVYVDSIDNLCGIGSDCEDIHIDNIEGYIRLIININAVWFTDDMFGLYLRPVHVEEIRQCEYQFQDQVNSTLFIDSEIAPKTQNIKKMDVNKLNNIVSTVKNELKGGALTSWTSSKKETVSTWDTGTNGSSTLKTSDKSNIGRRLRKQNNNSESLEIQDIPKTAVSNNKVESESGNLTESDSEVEINFEDSD